MVEARSKHAGSVLRRQLARGLRIGRSLTDQVRTAALRPREGNGADHVDQEHMSDIPLEELGPTYQPLQPGQSQFRVLELLPGEHAEERLRAKLRVVSTRDETSYETISYAWGAATKSASIEIAGTLLSIPDNTAAALRRLRQEDRARLVWIDAICINQDDVDERSSQVKLMSSIYAGSTYNLIHLTDDEAMSRRVLQVLYMIESEIGGITADYKQWKSLVYNENGSLAFSDPGYRYDFDREAVRFLISLPWFRRLWIVQEARLAPYNICHLGSGSYALAPLLRVITWLVSSSQLNRLSNATEIRGRDCALVLADLTDREYGWWDETSPSLANLIMFTRPFEKSEPRDGVYALLGISQRAAGRIVPDYRKSIERIEQETTRYMIRQRNDLWALRDVSHPAQGPRGCSWTIRVGEQPQTTGRPLVPSMLDFTAYGDLGAFRTVAAEDVSPETLVLAGIQVDTVVAASDPCQRSDLQQSDALQSWMLNAAADLGLSQVFDVDMRLVLEQADVLSLSCALMAEEAKSGRRATPEDVDLGADAIDALLDHDLLIADPEASRRAVSAATALASKHCKWDALIDRRLFKMRSGKCGLGPSAIRRGDTVTALRGSPWPAILRPYDENYQFIGLAYARGLMYGETIPKLRAAGVKQQWFVVR